MPESTVYSYKELVVWQKSVELVVHIYEFTESFPKSELYGLVSQMRRAAVSLPSNIAEGRRRGTRKDFRHFLLLAYGSGAELETQIEISKRLSFGKDLNFSQIESLLSEVMRMLNVMIKKLSSETTS
ncbi:MAG: four helix bundle protein [Candidatus Moraniibacteriota bacterium]